MNTVQAGRRSRKSSKSKLSRWIAIFLGVLGVGTIACVVLSAIVSPILDDTFSNIVSNCLGCGSSSGPAGPPSLDDFIAWSPANGEPFANTFFEHYGVNPFIDTEDDALSTFALDVDTASYTIGRSYLAARHLPPLHRITVSSA